MRDWHDIYKKSLTRSEDKKPLWENGLLRICTCAEEKENKDSDIKDCQKKCKHYKKWDAFCYHYRPASGHCDFRSE